MLFPPPLQRIKVVVIEHGWHGHLLALKDNALVHQCLGISAAAPSEHPHHFDPVRSMPDLSAHELALKRKLKRRYFLVNSIQIRLQPLNRLRRQIFVRVQSENPLPLNRQIVQRPIELN